MVMSSPHDHINNITLFTALQQASGLAPASEQSSTASQNNTIMSAQSNLDHSRQCHPSATSSTLAGAESTQPATSPTSPLSSSTPSGSNATTSAGSLPCQTSTCPTRISAARRHQAKQEKGLKTNKDVICGQIWQELFPDEFTVGGSGQVKTKIHWLTEQCNNIKKTISQQTGTGVLLQDMDHNSLLQNDPIAARVISSFSSSVAATPAAASSSSHSPFSSSSNLSSIGPTPFTITPIDTPTCQCSSRTAFEADEVDNGDGDSVYHSPATGTTPKKSRSSTSKSKREELSEIVWACTQDMLQAQIKVEEERTKREEMRIQFAREESERKEHMQTEECGWLMEMVQMMNPNLPFGNIAGSSQSNLDLDPLVLAMDQQDNSDSAHE
ncbi:hypothetical protein NDA18_003703 [Ustilago nuda]|nr:hypothetical protein NDA18_003703 [Ustilago nuda]